MPSLLLLSGPSAGLRHEIEDEATLGRSPSCEVPLQDTKVSRRHARIVVREGSSQILDLGSRNGTLLNGARIDRETPLMPGDRIQLGDTSVLFEATAAGPVPDRPDEFASNALDGARSPPGTERAIYNLGLALLRANSEAVLLRRAVEECALGLGADSATVIPLGSPGAEISQPSALAATDRKKATGVGQSLYVPLVSSSTGTLGVLHLERAGEFGFEDRRLAAEMGRLIGEGLAAVRRRAQGPLAAPLKKLSELVAQVERKAILEALSKAKGRKIRAAAMLGISRPTLDKKIVAYGLSIER